LCSPERQPACRRGGRLGWGFVADRVASPRLLLLGIALLMAVAAGLMSLFTTAWPVGAIVAVVILLGATASGWNGVFLAERDVRPAEVGLATSGSLMFTFSASYSDLAVRRAGERRRFSESIYRHGHDRAAGRYSRSVQAQRPVGQCASATVRFTWLIF
jgi:hypothetical protein